MWLKPALKHAANLNEWQEKLTLAPTRGQDVSRRLLSGMSRTDPDCESLDKHKNHLQKLRFNIIKLAENVKYRNSGVHNDPSLME